MKKNWWEITRCRKCRSRKLEYNQESMIIRCSECYEPIKEYPIISEYILWAANVLKEREK